MRLKSCAGVMAALFALSSDVVAGGAAEERSAEVSFKAIDILVNVSSTAENTGYRLNPEKMNGGVLGLIPAIEEVGFGPVVTTRPNGRVTVPGPAFTLRRYNFAGYCYKTERVTSGTFEIRPGEPIFLVRLLRKANGQSVGFARPSHG